MIITPVIVTAKDNSGFVPLSNNAATAVTIATPKILNISVTIPSPNKKRRNSLTVADLVSEYGKQVDIAKEALLFEYGECICPDHAVERYAALAASSYRR